MTDCMLCDEPMGGEPSSSTIQPIHRECALRSTMGGIGHLIDHAYWCKQMHDPDAGLPYRLSALLVDAWVYYYGVEDSVKMSFVPSEEQ